MIIVGRQHRINDELYEGLKFHQFLYDVIKNTDYNWLMRNGDVNSKDARKKSDFWASETGLIQTMITAIRSILVGRSVDKDFVEQLLKDFLFCIELNKLNFIYSIIIPILTIDDTYFVPMCLHPAFSKEQADKLLDHIRENN